MRFFNFIFLFFIWPRDNFMGTLILGLIVIASLQNEFINSLEKNLPCNNEAPKTIFPPNKQNS